MPIAVGFLEGLTIGPADNRCRRRPPGRVFQNLEEVREAVGWFVEEHDAHWRLEKLGFKTPLEAREEHGLRWAA